MPPIKKVEQVVKFRSDLGTDRAESVLCVAVPEEIVSEAHFFEEEFKEER